METSLMAQESILEGNKVISSNLGRTAISLNQTAADTEKILLENTNKADYLEVEITIVIDPLRFKDNSGKSILSEKALTEMSAGDLGSLGPFPGYSLVGEELKGHYDLVRKAVFSKWEFEFFFKRSISIT